MNSKNKSNPTPQSFDTADQAVDYLYCLQKFGIKFGLNSTQNLLAGLGDPHVGQKYVHIAGSNGKGSVAATLQTMLTAAGYRVGLYTSPHLVRFNERFRIGNTEISDAAVLDMTNALMKAMSSDEPPTFFEAVTAMALAYFKEQAVDLAIMETGMGGRLDATNVITPQVCMITEISLEHQDLLGTTLNQIAFEKAGIIKPQVPIITTARQPAALEVIEKRCHDLQAPLIRIGRDVRYRANRNHGFDYYGLEEQLRGLVPALKGHHQFRNMAGALATAEVLRQQGWSLTQEHLVAGLTQVQWPGRLEKVLDHPPVYLDGAHNPAAAKVLAEELKDLAAGRKLTLVLGIMADKDKSGILRLLVPLADNLILTRTAYARAADPAELAGLLPAGHHNVTIEPSLPQAIELAIRTAGDNGLAVITGSLFTVGEAKAYFSHRQLQP
ncbi:MAG: bifunctional folylpolyglutamate synthase/dihydrofolate synthase [Deltaproteobacteria bacterium]|nr:bifunctional folylpolyglutamate synthase/dihydrofolate synthase [Deltaproteobacteria bacterium]